MELWRHTTVSPVGIGQKREDSLKGQTERDKWLRTLFIATRPYAYFGVDGGIGPSGILWYFCGGKQTNTGTGDCVSSRREQSAVELAGSCSAEFAFSPS